MLGSDCTTAQLHTTQHPPPALSRPMRHTPSLTAHHPSHALQAPACACLLALCVPCSGGEGAAAAAAQDLRLWLQQGGLHECCKVKGRLAEHTPRSYRLRSPHASQDQRSEVRSQGFAAFTWFVTFAWTRVATIVLHKLSDGRQLICVCRCPSLPPLGAGGDADVHGARGAGQPGRAVQRQGGGHLELRGDAVRDVVRAVPL